MQSIGTGDTTNIHKYKEKHDGRTDSTSDIDHRSSDPDPLSLGNRLGLLIAVAALVAYRFTSVLAGPTPAVDRAQASLVEPAQQGVLDYLRAHALVQPLSTPVVPLDPAQQGVMDCVRGHDRVDRSPAFWDQAAHAVLDYLRAHSR